MCIYIRNIQVYQTVESVIDSYSGLLDLLESIEQFSNRLEIYTEVPPSVGMTDMIVKIVAEPSFSPSSRWRANRLGRENSSESGVSLS